MDKLEKYLEDLKQASNKVNDLHQDLLNSINKIHDITLYLEISDKLGDYINAQYYYTKIMLHSPEQWEKYKKEHNVNN